KAMQYEKFDPKTGKKFTWIEGESLEELSKPERVAGIKVWHIKQMEKEKTQKKDRPLHEVFEEALDSEDGDTPCLVCQL
ncbi:MAG: phosphoadenosine phosphosulfate reductase, partial [Candidatus Cloacimonetes bacterium]|nr:phosphoadenosine phosphosulfate reductase [Candidatus Cloacimonadota bacterium]